MFSNTEYVPVANSDYNNSGQWLWAIILFFGLIIFGGWFSGGNNNKGTTNGNNDFALASMLAQMNSNRGVVAEANNTNADIQRGFDNANIVGKLDGITNGLCQLGYDNLAQINTVNQNISQQGFNTQSGISQLGYNMQSCCCETNRNIDSVRYENAQNTCAIIQAQNSNTQKILDKMCETEVNNLREQLQLANFQISQQAQNATLINALRPTPTPSYLTCSPYQSQLLALNAFGNGCSGCNC
jgi:hypothetical protein